jgi:hypothetical protein
VNLEYRYLVLLIVLVLLILSHVIFLPLLVKEQNNLRKNNQSKDKETDFGDHLADFLWIRIKQLVYLILPFLAFGGSIS